MARCSSFKPTIRIFAFLGRENNTLSSGAYTPKVVYIHMVTAQIYRVYIILIMALPVLQVNINYIEEKGESSSVITNLWLTSNVEKIKGFLETFEGEKDVTRELADMDIRDEHEDRFRRLKYMRQLVRLFDSHPLLYLLNAASFSGKLQTASSKC